MKDYPSESQSAGRGTALAMCAEDSRGAAYEPVAVEDREAVASFRYLPDRYLGVSIGALDRGAEHLLYLRSLIES